MQRGDVYFTSVGNNFVVPSTSCQVILNWVHFLKLEAVPSAFPWAKVDEESLCRAKYVMRLSLPYEYPSASINLGINQFSRLWGKQKKFPKNNVECGRTLVI